MFKKRKSTQKDSSHNNTNLHKKVPLITIPSVTLNENRRIQTMPSAQPKIISKTMELKKQPCNSKKTISRKTTSRTNKFQNSLKPVSLQQLLKQVKQIRHYTLNETTNKSKSPLSTQSPSHHKLCPKSLSGTLKNKTTRKTTLNIGKTLRQLDFTSLFADQQSNFIYPSASDRPIDKGTVPSSEQMDGINIQEMQIFRKAAIPVQRFKVDIKSYDSLQETIAAITIQRAFRKYRTKRLIERYSQINCFTIQYAGSRILGQSQDFYGLSKNNQIKQVSDLQQLDQLKDERPEQIVQEKEEEINQYEKLVNSLKEEQMQKWNYILSLINNSKGHSFQDTAQLFKEIERQSKINREHLLQQTISNKSLELKANHQQKQEGQDYCIAPISANMHTESDSQVQYDCKKYIEELDSDVFPQAESSSSSKRIKLALEMNTISVKKQQPLLQQLKSIPKLGQNVLISSRSMKYLHKISKENKEEPNSARSRKIMSRCSSEKAIRRSLSNLSDLDLTDNIDFKMLQKQFLSDFPTIEQDTCVEFDNQNQQFFAQKLDLFPKEDIDNQFMQTSEKKELSILNERQVTSDIKIEEEEEREVREEESQCDNKGLLNISKCVNVTAMIIQHLQNELIEEIVSSLKLGSFFKQMSTRNKPKVRRAEHNKKRKGFPSDKKEIENFLQNFTNYLLIHHVRSLQNLQISTGPSAIELLKYMHAAEENSIQVDSQEDEGNIMVIPNKIFDLFWKIKQKSIVVQVPSNFTEENTIVFKQNVEYLKSFNKIFYRVLFDSFNQCLDSERNYGILGKPFPWKKTPAFPHKLELSDIKESLRNARRKMIDIAITYCGLIVETEDLNVAAGGEQYLQQVQEDRLSKMLATDLIQNERRWQFYDDQQAQILIEISNALYQQIVLEVIQDLIDFQ